ncbi:hypothetical protein [Herpetosiphon giganteus]|uniref:hypothetical protein n=1 Tax=Herpetosiphon giganteus TaxID=2029754 RepID=UPI00195D7FAD|nr:hypothetical protein [Herpetosiphon giganteus]MBM7841615.1 hypothetical protein [Herpetosiphon giganteus]
MRLASLYYQDNRHWHPLPGWGQFFLRLGQALGAKKSNHTRTVVGLVLPTRAYAAPLIASGIVFGKINTLLPTKNSHQHFTMLCQLPFGTSVIYRNNNNRLKGFIEDVSEIDGEIRIKIRVGSQKSGSLSHWLNQELAQSVDVSTREFERLPNSPMGKKLPTESRFLETFLELQNTRQFFHYSQMNCTIIGSLKDLENELTTNQFGVKTPAGDIIEGNLQHIIRVRRWLTNGEAYRSEIYPTSHPVESLTDNPDTVIFDTANSFLRWRNHFRSSNQVVILDKTDLYVEDAINVFNQGYIDHRTMIGGLGHFPPLPKGCEYVIYQEKPL